MKINRSTLTLIVASLCGVGPTFAFGQDALSEAGSLECRTYRRFGGRFQVPNRSESIAFGRWRGQGSCIEEPIGPRC